VTNDMQAQLARLLDRQEIEATLYRYARGVDRLDWDLVRSAYHPDATDDHGNYKGDIEGFIASVKARHVFIEQSMHLITNVTIEFDSPDGALVESYFITFQRVRPEAGAARENYLSRTPLAEGDAMQGSAVGRYVDRFTRRDGAWKIAQRVVVFEVYHGNPTEPGGRLRENWTVCRRDGSDPLELAQARLGLRR
jgi:hypothetical protein